MAEGQHEKREKAEPRWPSYLEKGSATGWVPPEWDGVEVLVEDAAFGELVVGGVFLAGFAIAGRM